MTYTFNNIIYEIDSFKKELKSLIKLSISIVVFFFFSFGKIPCEAFNLENKSITSRLE